MTSPKRIGFLSFGAWHPGGGATRNGADALRQTIELAVVAEEIGIDGAFVRVHHFARQLSSPFPLLAAIGVKTSRSAPASSTCATRTRSTWPKLSRRPNCLPQARFTAGSAGARL